MRTRLFPLFFCLLVAVAQAQVSAPSSDQTPPRSAATAVPSPAPPPAGVNSVLLQVEQAAGNLRVDLARLRIDKWKTDSRSKQQAQDNAQSLDRNIQFALPGMIQQVQAAPTSLAARFKLYRNVNALYDVLSGLTESAGAFGPKEDFAGLQNDAAAFDTLRRQMADQVEALAAQKDEQISRMASQARAEEAAPPEPPKKIVIDDTAPEKPATKPKTKKKAVPKPQEPPKPQA
ncbi:MAG TPA: hypothetical protein VFU76_06970 [Terriglobales bacterium]|nr:hypothetical protein [Terriglobales bacterium]